MKTIYLDRLDPFLEKIKNLTFPGYHGKKFKLHIVSNDYKTRLDNYWDGGSRTYSAIVDILNEKIQVPTNDTSNPFKQAAHQDYLLPDNCILIQHDIFCGKDMGLSFNIKEMNATKFLPKEESIQDDEKIVLSFTSGLKPCYAGISNYRFYEATRSTKITLDMWELAKTSCIEKKWLNKAGAITVFGRNILELTRKMK
jgi:hypothetical protein